MHFNVELASFLKDLPLDQKVEDAIKLFSTLSHNPVAWSQLHLQVQNWQRDKPLLLSNPTLRKEIFNILKQMEDHEKGDAEKGLGKQSPDHVASKLEMSPSQQIGHIRAMMRFTAEETDTFSLSQKSSPSEGGGAGLAGSKLGR